MKKTKSVKKQKDPVEEEVEYSDVILLFCQHVIMTLSLEVQAIYGQEEYLYPIIVIQNIFSQPL